MNFEHLQTIYRDFDIRGKYPEEINDDEVYKIAKALSYKFKPKKVAVGHDLRPSADNLLTSLLKGFTESGVDVVKLGLCTTPMSYFICGSTDVDMTVMITASHMPSNYNGLKITVEDAKPLSADVIQAIREIVGTHTFSEVTTHGQISSHALQQDWINQFKDKHDLSGSGLSVVIDPANMIGVMEIDTFKAFAPDIKVHTIFDTFDHTCPNHEANPIKNEVLEYVGKEVLKQKADLGIAFDGDADRVGFVDENGTPAPSDLVGALIARKILSAHKNAVVVCDVRASKSVIDEIEKLGGKAVREKVGHTYIRSRMRQEDAVLGIELSGHFFFKETFFSEGGPLPAFLLMELMKEEGKTLSQLIKEVRKYYHSGEINSTISKSVEDIYKELEETFPDARVSKHDGLTLEFDDWWCNIRPSANDPVLRLNLEANEESLMQEKRDQILAVIRAE